MFHGRDPTKVTFEEIADAAGVSRALVYDYFGDRAGLLEAVFRRSFDELQARVGKALVNTRGLREALIAMVRVHLEFASADPDAYRLACADANLLDHPALDASRIADTAATFGGGPVAVLVARGTLAALEAMVLGWVADPVLDRDDAAERIAQFLWSGLSGIDQLGLRLRPWWPVPEPV